jgi:2-iminoacetate synthase ThiH
LLEGALTISLPRMRPCAGEFEPLTHIRDRELAQLICALRLMFPDVGIVALDARTPKLRDGLIPLGVTMMSAGRARSRAATPARAGKNPSHRARHHQGTAVRRQRMGAAGKTPDERHRPVQHRRRTHAAGSRRSGSAGSATSRCGRIGTRR